MTDIFPMNEKLSICVEFCRVFSVIFFIDNSNYCNLCNCGSNRIIQIWRLFFGDFQL